MVVEKRRDDLAARGTKAAGTEAVIVGNYRLEPALGGKLVWNSEYPST